jgi:adenosylcobinamide-phosphate synthase
MNGRQTRTVEGGPAVAPNPLATGLVAGVIMDFMAGDPQGAGHPVAVFGRAAAVLERRVYADRRRQGVAFAAIGVCGALGAGLAAQHAVRSVWRTGPGHGTRRRRTVAEVLLATAATWAVVGSTSLAREAGAIADLLGGGDLTGARARLPHLCARDPDHLDEKAIARATVESVAENTSDAVVAPLFWGAVAGVPGLLAYRAVNTLDAMVGYHNPHYERFGWAAARLDDLANWAPARLTGVLTVALAPFAGGSPAESWRILRRDGARHPSPNAGRCEAAAAGALGVTLGGSNDYGGRTAWRPQLGDGPAPGVPDIGRAVRLSRAVTVAATVMAAVAAAGRRRR